MTAQLETTTSPEAPRKEIPRWVRRLHRVFAFLNTAGMSEWVTFKEEPRCREH